MIIWICGEDITSKVSMAELLIQDRRLRQYGPWVLLTDEHMRNIQRPVGMWPRSVYLILDYLEGQGLNVIVSSNLKYYDFETDPKQDVPHAKFIDLIYPNTGSGKILTGDPDLRYLISGGATEIDCIEAIVSIIGPVPVDTICNLEVREQVKGTVLNHQRSVRNYQDFTTKGPDNITGHTRINGN